MAAHMPLERYISHGISYQPWAQMTFFCVPKGFQVNVVLMPFSWEVVCFCDDIVRLRTCMALEYALII